MAEAFSEPEVSGFGKPPAGPWLVGYSSILVQYDDGSDAVKAMLSHAFASAIEQHALGGVGLGLEIKAVDAELDDEDVRTLRLQTRLALPRSPAVVFALFSHVRPRMETIDFGMSLKWRPSGQRDWKKLCDASLKDVPTRSNPYKQMMVMNARGLSIESFGQIRAAIFPPSEAAAAASVSDAALVAVVLAAAGATLDSFDSRLTRVRSRNICLGCAWNPARDYKFCAAAGIEPGAPGFPAQMNWIEHAARRALAVALPFDAHYKNHGFNCAVAGEPDSDDSDTDDESDQ